MPSDKSLAFTFWSGGCEISAFLRISFSHSARSITLTTPVNDPIH